MTTTIHRRSVHIDAPVEKVFDHVQDPEHFYEAWPGAPEDRPVLSDVQRTPEGAVSSYRWEAFELLGFHITGIMTREELVANQRIVDRSSTKPVWTWTFEPDSTGTTLSLAFEYSSTIPLADKLLDKVAWKGVRDIDEILANLKRSIEG